jgi:hypothetical protein
MSFSWNRNSSFLVWALVIPAATDNFFLLSGLNKISSLFFVFIYFISLSTDVGICKSSCFVIYTLVTLKQGILNYILDPPIT